MPEGAPVDPSTGKQVWALGRGWVVPHSMKLECLQVSFAAFPASMALQLESLPLRGWCVCVCHITSPSLPTSTQPIPVS